MKAIIIVAAMILIIFLICNYLYKKTNDYYNLQLDIRDFINGIPRGLKFVNTGSTYSKFAFSSLKDNNYKYADFSLRSQSLEMDRAILKQYIDNIPSNAVVAIVVSAPCLLLFKEKKDNLLYYNILRYSNHPHKNIIGKLKSVFPLLAMPKKIIRIIFDKNKIVSIYDTYPLYMTEEKSQKELQKLCGIWKELFGLNDFLNYNLSSENIENIEFNKRVIEDMINMCIQKEIRPVIVTTPFSKRLNKYFSNEFVLKVLHDNIMDIANKTNTPYLNYQFDEQFQDAAELFADGGFRLNKIGSRVFINRLFNDLRKNEIVLNNSTLRIED